MHRMEIEYFDGSRWPDHLIIVLYFIFYNGYRFSGILFLSNRFNRGLVNVRMSMSMYHVVPYYVNILLKQKLLRFCL